VGKMGERFEFNQSNTLVEKCLETQSEFIPALEIGASIKELINCNNQQPIYYLCD
jgi:hypothetical protein